MSKRMTPSSSKISVLFSIVIACLLAVVTLATFPSISSPIGGSVSGLFELLKDPSRKKSPGKFALADVALTPFNTTSDTGEKPQSKVWKHDGVWWAVMPSSSASPSGTWVWRLEANNSWTNVVRLSSSTNIRADVKSVGDVAHILLYGASPSLVSIEYVSASTTYQLWSARSTPTAISLPDSETATIDVDSTGRMWLATENGANVNVHYSVSPYSTFSTPITLANDVDADDIAVVVAMPGNRVGVLWSNQTRQQFGFRVRNDADDPATWGPDEAPASEATGRVADDHLNVKVAADGTLYAAVKTSYDSSGMPKIALLVRRPNGLWDPLYNVDSNGTRAIALLNETTNKIRVVYTASEGNNDILYRESDATSISFGPVQTLIDGSLNNVTSTKSNWSGDVVVLASAGSQTHGVRVEDGTPPPTPTPTPEPTVTPVPTPTPQPTPDNSLVGHWKMDETIAGSTAADSGELPANNAATTNTPTFTAGKYGNALTLNGTNQFATVVEEDSLDLTTGMTIAAWIKPANTGTRNILKKTSGTTAANGYELSISGTNTVFVRLNGNANYRIDSSTNPATNGSQWLHVAATFANGVIKLYINGIQEGGDKPMLVPIGTNNTMMHIGRDTGMSQNFFGGQIDDLRLYNRGLGLSEIQTLAEVAPTNTAPTVNAGTDQSATFPASASLVGTVTDDGLPAPPTLTTTWSTFSGPGTGTFGDANATSTTASFSAPGIYILRLTASDGVFTTTDDVQITVNNVDGFPPAVGHWRMDEGSGLVILDSSGNLNDGTNQGNPTWSTDRIYGSHSFNLDGTDDCSIVPDANSLDLSSSLTMAAWIKPRTGADTQYIIKKRTATTGNEAGYELSLASSGKVFARFGTGTSVFRVDSDANYPVNNSAWMHVAATWDGGVVRIYINGEENASGNFTGTIQPTALSLGIGCAANGATPFNGLLDDVRLYGSALTQEQITEIATVPPPVNTAPTVSAGDDQTIALPASANLNGTATDDGLPAPASLSTTWSKVSGDGDVTFGDASLPVTTATFSAPGVYILRLTANDGVFVVFDEVSITVQPASTIATSTFQYGVNGYGGTIDTFLSEGSPDSPQSASAILEWDQDQAGNGTQTVLIRFDDIFGTGGGQIPAGVYITSATLNYNAFEAGDSATVNEVAVDWDAAATYNNFGGDMGIQPDEYGTQIGTAPGSIGLQSVNVTSSLQGWIANPSLNRGWILRPDGGDGTDVRSSDVATVALRPSLSVTYTTVMPNLPPTITMISPANGSTEVPIGPALTVNVSDPNGDPLTVTYYGREASVPAANFSIIALPDTQNYSGHTNGGLSSTFTAQTQWIVDQRASRNIVFVTQLGDCVQNGNVELEWQRANSAISLFENPTTTGIAPFGIPYGIAVGNHDQSPTGDADGDTSLYNQYFGEARFAGRPYYGGHYGSNNDNHYQLFSASGLDFIIIHLEYDTTPDAAVLAWANNLLAANPTRRGIVTSHHIVNTGNPASFGTQGQAIYDALKGNANLFLMLSGHVSEEGRRTDVFGGNTVHSVLSDYQGRANGGDGWLRILNFKPGTDEIDIQTYSPTLGQFETDASSQFTLPYNMSAAGAPFAVIGTNTGVASGSNDSEQWFNILGERQYEWYATVSDGTHTVTSPVWNFTTDEVLTTSAPATISGRVLTSNGRGLSRVIINLAGPDGTSRNVTTNAFGYFTLNNVPSGQTYVLSGEARGYTINQQLISLTDNVNGLLLGAIPR